MYIPEGLAVPLLGEEVDDGVHDDADPVEDVERHVEAGAVEVLVNLKVTLYVVTVENGHVSHVTTLRTGQNSHSIRFL